MDDQTRGDAQGEGQPDINAPLKRDRKLLRSSKPLPPAQPPASTPPPTFAPNQDVREQAAPERTSQMPTSPEPTELTPAEQLLSGQWASTLPPAAMPASTSPPVPMPPTAPPPAQPSAAPPSGERAATESGEGSPERGSGQGPQPAAGSDPASAHPKLGPLAPTPVSDHPGLARLDVAALAAAILLPPIGLLLGIVAIARGKLLRGWASDLARAAIVVSLIMTVVFTAVGGYVGFTEAERAKELAQVRGEQRAHARIEATSAPFCETLAMYPTIYGSADPDYGWPTLDTPEGYLPAISNYSAAWAAIAASAPEGIAEETTAISQRVASIVGIASALGANNRAGDLLGLHEQDDLATVESWYIEYCPQGE